MNPEKSLIRRRTFLAALTCSALQLNTTGQLNVHAAPSPKQDARVQSNEHVIYGWDVDRGYAFREVVEGRQYDAPPPDFWLQPKNEYFFQHMQLLFDYENVSRGTGAVTLLDVDVADDFVSNVRVTDARGERIPFSELLDTTFTSALLVLHGGKIITERYWRGVKPDTLYWQASSTKSINACVAANLMEEGLLSRDALVTEYLPSFKQTAWDDVTVDHLLKMISGVRYQPFAPEDLADVAAGRMIFNDARHRKSNSEFARDWRSAGLYERIETDGDEFGTTAFLQSMTRAKPPGTFWTYNNADSIMLGKVCSAAAGGVAFDQLVSKFIWTRLGAEEDAIYLKDREGQAYPSGGLCANLRDLGRFAQMMLNNGFFNGKQIVPAPWVKSILTNHAFVQDKITDDSSNTRKVMVDPKVGRSYNDQFWTWWGGGETGAYAAQGAGGQWIYIHPMYKTAIVKFSAHPDYSVFAALLDLDFFAFRDVAKALDQRAAGPQNGGM
jgi:CubicO group peptidase (beta-lactamase class C family)